MLRNVPQREQQTLIERFDARPARHILTVSLFALGMFLLRAGSFPLIDPDEGRYAEMAREMAFGGDWLVPHLFGIPYLEKPPLLFWLTAGIFRLLGSSELTARLVPAFAGALGVLAVGIFTARQFRGSAGVLASVVLALAGLYLVLARALLVDTLFSVSLAAALFALFAWRESPRGSHALAAGFWLSLAAATLAKGPAALILCAAIVAIDAALPRGRRLVYARLLLTAPLYLALTLPWFALIQLRYPQFFSFYLWKEHLDRIAGSEHAAPIWWFVPWLLLGFLPWTPLAIAAAPGWWRSARENSPDGRGVRFLLVWAATVFTLFSIAEGKLVTYILPMFPPLAVLTSLFLDRLLRGGAVTVLLGRDRSPERPIAVMIGATVALYVTLALVGPTLAEAFTARSLVAAMTGRFSSTDHFAFYGGYLPSTAFYLGRSPFLVGVRQELRLGKALAGDVPELVPDLGALCRRTEGARLYVFTDNRAKRRGALRDALGGVELVARNYAGTLWLRKEPPPPSAAPTAAARRPETPTRR